MATKNETEERWGKWWDSFAPWFGKVFWHKKNPTQGELRESYRKAFFAGAEAPTDNLSRLLDECDLLAKKIYPNATPTVIFNTLDKDAGGYTWCAQIRKDTTKPFKCVYGEVWAYGKTRLEAVENLLAKLKGEKK